MKKIIVNTVLTLIFVFIISLVWEFFIAPNMYQDFPETITQRWEYIFTVLFFCFAALIVPTILSVINEKEKIRVEAEREKYIIELRKAIEEIKTLRGIIPICMYCKKIKRDKDVWDQLEVYLQGHSEADFSHGCCPDCLEKQKQEVEQIKISLKDNSI